MLPSWLLGRVQFILGWLRFRQARRLSTYMVSPVHQSGKPNILFFNIGGMSFSGTEKFLQILAKHLNKEKFNAYFLYSSQKATGRENYVKSGGVELIDFIYKDRENTPPFLLHGSHPKLRDVLKDKQIDLVVSAGAGLPEHPLASIGGTPIIDINVFGSINPQPDIAVYLCISDTLKAIVKFALPKRTVERMYIQSEGPDAEALRRGQALRLSLGLKDGDLVFGRIGRPDNAIFDPIGLLAFKKISDKYQHVHYLILAPAPAAKQLVEHKKIPRVHFLPPTSSELEIWAFHNAIDVLAHFRKDGETQGLNIGEAMFCGKPIISHKSSMWNAHLEYLDPSFSFIAGLDNIDEYASFMETFAQDQSRALIKKMGAEAKKVAYEKFHIFKHIGEFEQLLRRSLGGK